MCLTNKTKFIEFRKHSGMVNTKFTIFFASPETCGLSIAWWQGAFLDDDDDDIATYIEDYYMLFSTYMY